MKNRGLTSLIIATIAVASVITINQLFSLELGNKITTTLSPVGVVISTTGQRIGGFFGGIGRIGTLQKDNKVLEDKLNTALVEIARLTEAKKENDSLKRDLGYKQTTSLDLVAGYVAYFDSSLRDGITVLVDDAAGIEIGNVVLAEGFLVGRVSRIEGRNVHVLLTTDSLSSIPATIQNKTITGIAKGKIGSGLTMEQVPQSDNVVKEDIVVTSGLGGEIPKGLIIGKVEEVKKISGSIFQGIILQPMLGLTTLERVMIAR
jgi:rod shape-determining protein MreC